MYDVSNLRATIIPKSDQLNAEQLLAGPMTITVDEVRTSASDEQPVVIHYEGENGRPYKPCKTMRKVLILAWGEDGRKWAGKSMTVYNQPDIKFGGAEVGGIRISHLSDIAKDIQVALTATRGKKAQHVIKRLDTADARHMTAIQSAASLDDLKAAYEAAYKSTRDAVRRDAFAAAKDRRKDELTAAPAATGATKDAAAYIADIERATDGEVAALVLDEARSALDDDGAALVADAWRAKWGSA